MPQYRLIRAKCLSCGKPSDVKAFYSINVADSPELKGKVKDGSLFIWECPFCGAHNLVKTDLLYHDPDKKLMVWLLPDEASDKVGDREAKVSDIAESLDGYTLRRVKDVGSLIEKVNIFDAGLDDIVIEICKYVTKMELAEKGGDKSEAILKAPFRFLRTEGADNQLIFTFPLDGKMQAVPVGFSIYEDSRGILSRNPQVADSVKGFATIDSSWLSQHFR